MEKEKLESLLIDYIDGNLNEADKAIVEKELEQNQEAATLHSQLKEVMSLLDKARHIEPSFTLRAKFERSLSEEISSQQGKSTSTKAPADKQIFLKPWILRAAAGIILVIVGIVIGERISVQRQHEQELVAIQKKMDEQKDMLMAMLENQQSASQRVMGANVAYEMKQAPDDEIVNALVKAMDEDPNTNVRLTALEALGKFYHQNHVRRKLIQSLATQKDPVVQIALIRLLVQMKEKEVVNQLEKITQDDMTIKAVKDEAHSGILKLS